MTAGDRHRLGSRARALARHRGVLALTVCLGFALVATLTLAGSRVYRAVAREDGVAGLDQPVLDLALRHRSPSIDRGLTLFTQLGGPLGMTIIAALITAALLWRWRRATPAILMVTAVAGSLALTVVGKEAFARERPPQIDAVPPYESSPSFPSGHALNSTVIAGMIAYLVILRLVRALQKLLTVMLAVGWAVAMGTSRVFLGHHWLTDVMCGWLVGAAWLTSVVTIHQVHRQLTASDPAEAAAAIGP